jgi:hypothetical protein
MAFTATSEAEVIERIDDALAVLQGRGLRRT